MPERRLSTRDKRLSQQLELSPAEYAADAAQDIHPGNINELETEIANKPPGKGRDILIQEHNRIKALVADSLAKPPQAPIQAPVPAPGMLGVSGSMPPAILDMRAETANRPQMNWASKIRDSRQAPPSGMLAPFVQTPRQNLQLDPMHAGEVPAWEAANKPQFPIEPGKYGAQLAKDVEDAFIPRATDTEDQTMFKAGQGLLGFAAGGKAPSGSLGVLAGRRAKGAPAAIHTLESAGREKVGKEYTDWLDKNAPSGSIPKELEPERQAFLERADKPFLEYSPETLWAKHGISVGAEGKPRWEISDLDAELKQWPAGKETQWLPDVLDHPKLFEAYPQLKRVAVTIRKPDERKGATWYGKNPGGNQWDMEVHPGDYNRATILHEVQHAIQDIEQFARGGNAGMFPTKIDQQVKLLEEAEKTFKDQGISITTGVDPLGKTELTGANKWGLKGPEHEVSLNEPIFEGVNETFRKFRPTDPFDRYLELAGEVEARNVERRMLHPNLKYVDPRQSETVPRDLQELIQNTPDQIFKK